MISRAELRSLINFTSCPSINDFIPYNNSLRDVTKTTLCVKGNYDYKYALSPNEYPKGSDLLIPLIFRDDLCVDYSTIMQAIRNASKDYVDKKTVKGVPMYFGNGIIADGKRNVLCLRLFKYKENCNYPIASTLIINKKLFEIDDKEYVTLVKFILSKMTQVQTIRTLYDYRDIIPKTIEVMNNLDFVNPTPMPITNTDFEQKLRDTALKNINMIYEGIRH